MKINVDKSTVLVVYPGLPDQIIQIENPADRAVVMLDVSSVDKMIEALKQAKEAMQKAV